MIPKATSLARACQPFVIRKFQRWCVNHFEYFGRGKTVRGQTVTALLLIIGPSVERICRSFFSSAIEIFNFYTSFFSMLTEKELHKMSCLKMIVIRKIYIAIGATYLAAAFVVNCTICRFLFSSTIEIFYFYNSYSFDTKRKCHRVLY